MLHIFIVTNSKVKSIWTVNTAVNDDKIYLLLFLLTDNKVLCIVTVKDVCFETFLCVKGDPEVRRY